VRRRADQVFTTSIDGWTCGSPTAVLTDPGRQAMLVIEMNGEPLSIEHGFPIRMIVPRALRFRVRYQVDHRHGLTTFDTKRAYRLQRGWCSGPRSRRCPVSTVPARSDGSTRTLQSQVLHGRRQRASRRSRYALTAASGDPRSYPLRSTWTPGGCSGCGDGGNPATTWPKYVRRTRPATPRLRTVPRPFQTAPVDGIQSSSPSFLNASTESAAADHRSNEKRAGYSTSVSNS
jgi:molybdopterin-dependent oxidoreductase-like protein protein